MKHKKNVLIFAIFVVLLLTLAVIVPQDVADANAFVHTVDVKVLRVSCDNGVLRHYAMSWSYHWANHQARGSHQHPSPVYNVTYVDTTCTREVCWNCS